VGGSTVPRRGLTTPGKERRSIPPLSANWSASFLVCARLRET
jgi:hypothetical protein